MTDSSTRLVVNGAPVEVEAAGLRSLADVLRQDLRLTATKVACGRGECGACTVLVGGKPRMACTTPAALVREDVWTSEGLAAESADLRARFADTGAFQCGFCTPGQIVHATALLRDGLGELDDDARRARVRAALSGNICRCTGYQAIVESVCGIAADRAGRSRAVTRVGDRLRPIDWDARSTGLVAFTADLPGEHLHGAILRSPVPYAEITALDTARGPRAARGARGHHRRRLRARRPLPAPRRPAVGPAAAGRRRGAPRRAGGRRGRRRDPGAGRGRTAGDPRALPEPARAADRRRGPRSRRAPAARAHHRRTERRDAAGHGVGRRRTRAWPPRRSR